MNKNEHQMNDEPEFIYAPESDTTDIPVIELKKWKILIVDDEPDIHEVTQMSLNDFEFSGSGLEFLGAYSAKQAKEILTNNSDIAVALIDVVMEKEHSGLELVKFIREKLKNSIIRLILRTGQPGQAPQREVVKNFWLYIMLNLLMKSLK